MLSIDIEKVSITLCLTRGFNFPQWHVPYSFIILNEEIINDNVKLLTIEFFIKGNSIEIYNNGKTSKDTIVNRDGIITNNQNLKIENILINNIKIDLLAIQEYVTFVPEYTASRVEYAKQNNIELLTSLHTYEMYDNGVWELKFDRPFFSWYNKILMKLITTSDSSIWLKRSHLGLADANVVDRLEKLLSKL